MLRRKDSPRALAEVRVLRSQLEDALARLNALERELLEVEDEPASATTQVVRGPDDSIIMDARWLELGRIDDDWVDYTPLAADPKSRRE